MNFSKNIFEKLESCDSLAEDQIEKVFDQYNTVIGAFLIVFSFLDHELNLAIVEFLGDDFHETGYTVIEKLSMSNKIDLFYKLYVRQETLEHKKGKEFLDKIKKQLELINVFRNSIVHANWYSLDKDGFVRTKIVVDNQEGFVKFKREKISPKIIKEKAREVSNLVEEISSYIA